MTVRPEAFEELLDCAACAEEEGEANGKGEERRMQFVLEVDRCVRRALAKDDDLPWRTATLRKFKCRVYFFRHDLRLFLVGCVRVGREADQSR